MTWRCPACSTAINHNRADDVPRVGIRYRCHICRLELVLDGKNQRLTVAPLSSEPLDDVRDAGEKPRRRP